MTGVGGRPEIIIEGTNDNDIDKAVWKVTELLLFISAIITIMYFFPGV